MMEGVITYEPADYLATFRHNNHSPLLRAYVSDNLDYSITADHDAVAAGYDAVWGYELELVDDRNRVTTIAYGNDFISPEAAYEAVQIVKSMLYEHGDMTLIPSSVMGCYEHI